MAKTTGEVATAGAYASATEARTEFCSYGGAAVVAATTGVSATQTQEEAGHPGLNPDGTVVDTSDTAATPAPTEPAEREPGEDLCDNGGTGCDTVPSEARADNSKKA